MGYLKQSAFPHYHACVDFTVGPFCTRGEEKEEEQEEDCERDCQPLYGRVISFLIKFLDMQFAFLNVLGFSSDPAVTNHEWLISGTVTEGAILVHTHAKATFQA